MDSSQHGARGGRSTLSQLLVQHDHVLKMLEEGDNMDMVYLDFEKAFDKVDHPLLLRKLAALGVEGDLGRWIGAFLSSRRQAVKVAGFLSSWAPVTSGVPQGTVLGPILFLIFIGDLVLPDGSQAVLLKYVDDTKVMRRIQGMEDVLSLQADLEHLFGWQVANNMAWNSTKFQALRMGGKPSLWDSTVLLTPDSSPIPTVHQAKDLGILVDDRMYFKPQRQAAIAKVKAKSGWVLRTFRSRTLPLMKALWTTIIRPHQDYGSQLWAPVGSGPELRAQEAPLRAFTKRIEGLRALHYWDRLAICRMYSTERRVERYRIIYVWKIVRGLVPNCGMDWGTHGRRGLLVQLPPLSGSRMAIRTLREKAFHTEAARLFNLMPGHLREHTGSTLSFKSAIDAVLASVPDTPSSDSRRTFATDGVGAPTNRLVH